MMNSALKRMNFALKMMMFLQTPRFGFLSRPAGKAIHFVFVAIYFMGTGPIFYGSSVFGLILVYFWTDVDPILEQMIKSCYRCKPELDLKFVNDGRQTESDVSVGRRFRVEAQSTLSRRPYPLELGR